MNEKLLKNKMKIIISLKIKSSSGRRPHTVYSSALFLLLSSCSRCSIQSLASRTDSDYANHFFFVCYMATTIDFPCPPIFGWSSNENNSHLLLLTTLAMFYNLIIFLKSQFYIWLLRLKSRILLSIVLWAI